MVKTSPKTLWWYFRFDFRSFFLNYFYLEILISRNFFYNFSVRHWEITVFSPTGKGFKTNKEIAKFVRENPNVAFSPELTTCNKDLLNDLKTNPIFTPSHQSSSLRKKSSSKISTPDDNPRIYRTRSVTKNPKRLFEEEEEQTTPQK